MREIPSEVAALLKSRSMIGANKPTCEVIVEGMSNNDIDLTNNTFYLPKSDSTGRFSFAQCKDGKIIALYSNGTNTALIQGYASDLDSFNANNSVTNTSEIFTNSANIRGTVFNDNVGELYLAVARTTSTATETNQQQVRLYKSTSGNGGDWALYGTIRDSIQTEEYVLHYGTPMGAPLILESGRWVITYPYFTGGAGVNFRDKNGVATSDDNGLTWTHRNAINLDWNLWQSRKLAKYNGKIWRFVYSTYSSGTADFYYSSDDGVTWTLLGSLKNHTDFIDINKAMSDISFFTAGGYLYFFYGDAGIGGIYKTKTPDVISSWEKVFTTTSVTSTKRDTYCNFFNDRLVISIQHFVLSSLLEFINLPVKLISINRNKNMAGSLSLSIDNKNGEWSPDNIVNQNVLWPNKEITVKQGYGVNLINTFKGLIDRVEMTTFPQELKLSVRDKLKLALDQTITWTDNSTHVILFQSQPIETIFTILCGYAGLITGIIETTGISITKTFSWETYADCFQWLADLVGFEYGCDENGLIYFRKDTTPSTPTIAYEFKEGEDIISLGYTIDDNDIYSKVVVYGKDINDNVIFAQKEFVSKDYYNVLSQKFMKIDVSEASTVAQLQTIADRAEMLMRSRVREVSFASIAVPWLQVGDIIRIVESSTTISELYRITDLSTNYDSNGYTMQITCYHHLV